MQFYDADHVQSMLHLFWMEIEGSQRLNDRFEKINWLGFGEGHRMGFETLEKVSH